MEPVFYATDQATGTKGIKNAKLVNRDLSTITKDIYAFVLKGLIKILLLKNVLFAFPPWSGTLKTMCVKDVPSTLIMTLNQGHVFNVH